MSTLRVILVEDERAAALTLQQMLRECCPTAEVLAMLDSVRGTERWLRENPAPDLIFMDIHLADGECFELFKRIAVPSPVIFTTAYDQHALEAFRANGIDYLLKPLELPDLARSLAKFEGLRQGRPDVPPVPDLNELLRSLKQLPPAPAPTLYRTNWLAVFKNKFVPVEVGQVAYFSIRHGAVTLTTLEGQRYLLDASLDELEAQTDPRLFFRGNRQILFAKRSIADLEPYYNSRLLVNLTPQAPEEVIISKPRVAELKAWLNAL